ncbi:MAG TPA: class I SAM-dependent methyltransferase [Terricaulis sp.]|nr:class I SAM-dependent methyltransferase [Terricaulis sp.]
MSDPIAEQASYWDAWNAENREHAQSDISHDQKEAALGWLSATGRFDLDILEVGCGAGWLCPWLKPYGRVTATDLSPDVLRRAAERIAGVEFINGDFMTLDFPEHGFDVVVTLEVLSHVGDQPAFIAKIARLLRRGGVLILATQNRPVLERHNEVAPTQAGHLRRWFDRNELSELLAPHFTVEAMRTMTPIANKGPMRLIAGRWGRRVMRALSGRRLETTLGSAGFGWTLMTLARKA